MNKLTVERIRIFYDYCIIYKNKSFESSLWIIRLILTVPTWSYNSHSSFRYNFIPSIVKLVNENTDINIMIKNKTKYKSDIIIITVE